MRSIKNPQKVITYCVLKESEKMSKKLCVMKMVKNKWMMMQGKFVWLNIINYIFQVLWYDHEIIQAKCN